MPALGSDGTRRGMQGVRLAVIAMLLGGSLFAFGCRTSLPNDVIYYRIVNLSHRTVKVLNARSEEIDWSPYKESGYLERLGEFSDETRSLILDAHNLGDDTDLSYPQGLILGFKAGIDTKEFRDRVSMLVFVIHWTYIETSRTEELFLTWAQWADGLQKKQDRYEQLVELIHGGWSQQTAAMIEKNGEEPKAWRKTPVTPGLTLAIERLTHLKRTQRLKKKSNEHEALVRIHRELGTADIPKASELKKTITYWIERGRQQATRSRRRPALRREPGPRFVPRPQPLSVPSRESLQQARPKTRPVAEYLPPASPLPTDIEPRFRRSGFVSKEPVELRRAPGPDGAVVQKLTRLSALLPIRADAPPGERFEWVFVQTSSAAGHQRGWVERQKLLMLKSSSAASRIYASWAKGLTKKSAADHTFDNFGAVLAFINAFPNAPHATDLLPYLADDTILAAYAIHRGAADLDRLFPQKYLNERRKSRAFVECLLFDEIAGWGGDRAASLADPSLFEDREWGRQLMQRRFRAYRFLPPSVQADENIFVTALIYGADIKWLPADLFEKVRNDASIYGQLLKADPPRFWPYASAALRSDRSAVRRFIEINPEVFDVVDNRYRYDPEIASWVFAKDPTLFFRGYLKKVEPTPEVLTHVAGYEGGALVDRIPMAVLRDRNHMAVIIEAAFKSDQVEAQQRPVYQYVPEELWKDMTFVRKIMTAVAPFENCDYIEYLPGDVRSRSDVVAAARDNPGCRGLVPGPVRRR